MLDWLILNEVDRKRLVTSEYFTDEMKVKAAEISWLSPDPTFPTMQPNKHYYTHMDMYYIRVIRVVHIDKGFPLNELIFYV